MNTIAAMRSFNLGARGGRCDGPSLDRGLDNGPRDHVTDHLFIQALLHVCVDSSRLFGAHLMLFLPGHIVSRTLILGRCQTRGHSRFRSFYHSTRSVFGDSAVSGRQNEVALGDLLCRSSMSRTFMLVRRPLCTLVPDGPDL